MNFPYNDGVTMLTTHRVTHAALSSAGARRAEGGVRGTHGHALGTGGTFLDRDGKCRDTKVNRGAWGRKTPTAAGARGRRQTRRQKRLCEEKWPREPRWLWRRVPPGSGVSSPGRGERGSSRGAAPALADLGGLERLRNDELECQNQARSPRVGALERP